MKTITRSAACFILLLLVGTTALFFLQPRIPLGALSRPASFLLTRLTGSEQVIRGRYFLVPGVPATFSIEEGSLALTGSEDFRLKADIASAQAKVHLWSLVKKEINLDGLYVHGMILDIKTGGKEEDTDSDRKDDDSSAPEIMSFTLVQTGPIDLGDISAKITDQGPWPQISFLLEEGKGGFSYETPVQFTLSAIVNERKFGLDIQGGSPADLAALATPWPISVNLRHKSVVADARGSVVKGETGPELTAEFSLAGEHLDDLVSILGIHGSHDQSFSLAGTSILSQGEIRTDFSRVQMGRENFAISISVKDYISREAQYAITMRDEHFDLDSVKSFFTPAGRLQEKESGRPEKTKITRDDIILPSTFPLMDLTIDLDIEELVIGGRKIENLRLNAVIIDGMIDNSPFAANFKNAAIEGRFSLTTDRGVPELSVHFDATSFDFGTLLNDLQLADDIIMHVENTTMDLKTKGKTLGGLLANLEFTVNADNGVYEYRDSNTGTIMPVYLETTEVVGMPGKKIAATIQGCINDSPISIVIDLEDRRDESPGSVNIIPVALDIRIAGTQWKLAGKIPLPFSKEGTVLHSMLAGENLSSLNEVLPVQLPGFGPFEIAGELRIVPRGYSIQEILVRVGSSELNGNIFIDTRADPPEVNIGLEAQRIQLDDFRTVQKPPRKEPDRDTKSEDREKRTTAENKKNRLIDQAVIASYDASIRLDVREVVSGADHLGSGTMQIEQKQGRFRVSPLEIKLPEGAVNIDFSVSPSDPDRLYTLHMNMDNLDYGFVARYFKPETDMSGTITLHASLESISPDRQGILPNGSGYLDFCIQPRKLRAGVIDLWAVNLLSYLLPILAPKEESIIHCAAGRFNLSDGTLIQDELLIDTSQIRVKGVVQVDFNTNRIDATLRPIPKRPQFYSLSTPIEIRGTLADFDAGITTGGVIGTIIRLATSYVAVPLQWILQNKLPEDGTADCVKLVEERAQ